MRPLGLKKKLQLYNNSTYTIESIVYCSHLPHAVISRKVVRKSARENLDPCARGTFLTCIPSLPVAPPPNQHSTPTLMSPATQATKGIVDGFESTVLQRNLKEWHERPWTYVCCCWRKTTNVGSTASVSGTVYLSHPYYLSGLSRALFFPTTFIKIAVW